MTGTNFKFLDRNNPRLVRLKEKYDSICDENRELMDAKIRYGEESPEESDRYYSNQTRLKHLAYQIWCEAFYTYGNTNQAANDWCRNHGILDY